MPIVTLEPFSDSNMPFVAGRAFVPPCNFPLIVGPTPRPKTFAPTMSADMQFVTPMNGKPSAVYKDRFRRMAVPCVPRRLPQRATI